MKAQTQIMSESKPASTEEVQEIGLLQRKCACGHSSGLMTRCTDCGRKRLTVQRYSSSPAVPSVVPSTVNEVLSSSGQPLDSATRAFMETRFSHDFSQVRVHTDAQAAASARNINARAYTFGQHIAFAAGEYAPASPEGRRLLSHELAHTIQQEKAAQSSFYRADASPELGAPDAPEEDEADRLAAAVVDETKPVPIARRATAPVLRRQTPTGTSTPAQGSSTASRATPTAQPEQWAQNVNLGHFTRYYTGEADARLDRRPALAYLQRGGRDEVPPCRIDLFLLLHFEFHLGPSPYFPAGPSGSMTPEGPPWPAGRAAQWKRDYMRGAQQIWHTRHALERTGTCSSEPCTRAVGQLRIVDADTMTDSEGQPAPAGQPSRVPHFTVRVYEFRPRGQISRVEGAETRLYEQDIVPRGTPAPSGYDTTLYEWTPGNAPHETGHMLGRPHVNCSPNVRDVNDPDCYGVTEAQRANIMGRGSNVSREDHAPFIAAMRATTQCEWHVPGGGLPPWAIALLFVPVVGWLIVGIAALAGAFRGD